MLAEKCGKLIRDQRVRRGLSQEELARKAQVSRSVLSKLEQEKPSAVQSDSIDRLLAALEVRPQIGQSDEGGARKIARLEHNLRRSEQKARHLRLAIDLSGDEAAAAVKVAKARQRVELWRSNRSCSPFYIERWSKLLSLSPRQLAKEMSSLGEWEDAMFQNSPWSWAWT